MARYCAALVVVAAADIRKGLDAGVGRPGQYCIIRSAIPLEIFTPRPDDRRAVRRELGLPDDAPVVGNVGRFSAQKNPLEWVHVAAIIAGAAPQARFLLVGDGPLRPEVQALLEQTGLAGQVVLPGLRRDVARMLAAMDVFLLTSLWEGLPRVIPQALATGLPVVATRADGSAEAVEPGVTGYLCAPGDLECLAQRVLDLLAAPDLRAALGANGRRTAQQEFDLNAMIAKIDALYTRLLHERGAPTI